MGNQQHLVTGAYNDPDGYSELGHLYRFNCAYSRFVGNYRMYPSVNLRRGASYTNLPVYMTTDQNLKHRIDRFNEIENEIARLRIDANSQANAFINAYNGNSKSTFLLVAGVVATVVLSAINVALGIFALVFLGLLIYAQHSIARDHKTNMNRTLARIDELRAEQSQLDV